jgi:hypothetical protein
MAEQHAAIAAAVGWVAQGSQGQVIEHPLSASARSARGQAARILAGLKPPKAAQDISTQAREAARARWGRR